MADAEAAPVVDSSVEVLACNWLTVEVYQTCQLGFASGAGGAICLGIPATEIHAALQLQRVPRPQWREVAAGIQLMGRVGAAMINTAIERATKHRP